MWLPRTTLTREEKTSVYRKNKCTTRLDWLFSWNRGNKHVPEQRRALVFSFMSYWNCMKEKMFTFPWNRKSCSLVWCIWLCSYQTKGQAQYNSICSRSLIKDRKNKFFQTAFLKGNQEYDPMVGITWHTHKKNVICTSHDLCTEIMYTCSTRDDISGQFIINSKRFVQKFRYLTEIPIKENNNGRLRFR